MVQRLSLHGRTYVVVRISGENSLSEQDCCVYMAAAVAVYRGWLEHVTFDALSTIPGLPVRFLYLEGYRFMQNERRGGPVFGRNCLPWTSDSSCGLVEWRERLQDQLAGSCVTDWEQILLRLRTAISANPDVKERPPQLFFPHCFIGFHFATMQISCSTVMCNLESY